jgi:alkanesulfonate monooxygenase SsuD/methylene tetrahydromethanopterin reductase-like flavin-dependent oxidoreductase (luciferase family)
MFGYPLGDVPTRAARFEEALEVMTLLLRSREPVNFEGQFYHLRNAVMEPHPQREGGPPILIGGNGPRRTLPLVAKYAGIWNAVGLQPDAFEERSKRLDGLLREAGRKPEDVQRTAMVPVLVWRDEGEIETRLGWARRMFPDIDAQRPSDLVAAVRGRMPEAVMGTPDEVLETLRAFERAGCQEIMIQWFNLPDREGIRAVAQDVMPRLDDGE